MLGFSLDDEQEAFRLAVRTFAERVLAPRVDEVERTQTFPLDIFRDLGALGYQQQVTQPARRELLGPSMGRDRARSRTSPVVELAPVRSLGGGSTRRRTRSGRRRGHRTLAPEPEDYQL